MTRLVHEHETLVAALRSRGVDYLTPTDARLAEPVDDGTLIASLASHSNARLRQALVSLFLLHPELSPLAAKLRDKLEPGSATELTAYYTAAMYLQRMWRIRLGHYFLSFPILPDYFSLELALPSPDDEYGKVGLYSLAEWHASQSPFRFNRLAEYESTSELLFQSLELRRRSREHERKS